MKLSSLAVACGFSVSVIAFSAQADQVVATDLIVQSSTCVGAECVDGETFGFETLKIKGASPQVLFDDTSNSSSFPANDWKIGVADAAAGTAASFFIEDASSGQRVFEISPEGGIALGTGSEVVAGAVSVGGSEFKRRITNVADPVSDTDAVNLRTAQGYIDAATVSSEADEVNAAIEALNTRLSALADRITALEN